MYRKQITNKIMRTIKCAMQKSNLAELNNNIRINSKPKNKCFKISSLISFGIHTICRTQVIYGFV